MKRESGKQVRGFPYCSKRSHAQAGSSLELVENMAGTTGLEPAASAVTGQRSNQLNYVPTCQVNNMRNRQCLWALRDVHIVLGMLLVLKRARFLSEPPPKFRLPPAAVP